MEWTTVKHHPIVNIIMGVRFLYTLRSSIHTMGEQKRMDLISSLIVEHIKEIGEGKVFVVCMDGTCKGDFVLIQKEFPWVQCFVCVEYGMDGFLKNPRTDVQSSSATGSPVLVPDGGSPRQSENQGHPKMCI